MRRWIKWQGGCTLLFIAFKQMEQQGLVEIYEMLHSALHRIQTYGKEGRRASLQLCCTLLFIAFKPPELFFQESETTVALCSSSHSNYISEWKTIVWKGGCTLLFIAFKPDTFRRYMEKIEKLHSALHRIQTK